MKSYLHKYLYLLRLVFLIKKKKVFSKKDIDIRWDRKIITNTLFVFIEKIALTLKTIKK